VIEREKAFEKVNEVDGPESTDQPKVADIKGRLPINRDELPKDCDKGNPAVAVILTDSVGE
jgi:hypothetical protein